MDWTAAWIMVFLALNVMWRGQIVCVIRISTKYSDTGEPDPAKGTETTKAAKSSLKVVNYVKEQNGSW